MSRNMPLHVIHDAHLQAPQPSAETPVPAADCMNAKLTYALLGIPYMRNHIIQRALVPY